MPQGTGYTNIQSYLAANRGNRLSNTLSAGISKKAGDAGAEITKQQTAFGDALNAEKSRLSGLKTGADTVVNKLDTNPSTVVDNDVNQYKAYQGATYSGPAGLNNQELVRQKAATAASIGNLAGSQTGRQELLRSFINRPDYTQSKQRLDSLLVGGNVDAQLRGARKESQRIPGQLDSALQTSANQAETTRKDLLTNKQAVGNTVSAMGGALDKLIKERVAQKQMESDAFNKRLEQQELTGLTGYGAQPTNVTLSQLAAAKKYGSGGNYWNSLVTPQYAQNITPGGLASEQERAKAAALSKLLENASYNQYTSGDAYVAPSVALNPERANTTAMGLYDRLTGGMTFNELAKYHPELNGINLANRNDPYAQGSYTLVDAIKRMDEIGAPKFDPTRVAFQNVLNKLRNEFKVGVTPTNIPLNSGTDTGYIKG
jgi:hypothetical protein